MEARWRMGASLWTVTLTGKHFWRSSVIPLISGRQLPEVNHKDLTALARSLVTFPTASEHVEQAWWIFLILSSDHVRPDGCWIWGVDKTVCLYLHIPMITDAQLRRTSRHLLPDIVAHYGWRMLNRRRVLNLSTQ
jgi:hypothetical protein